MPKPKEKIQRILAEIERMASLEGIPIIGPMKGRFLRELIQKHKPKRALEIGTAIGYSGILIAQGLPEEGHLDTVEMNPLSAERAAQHFEEAGLAGKVSLITGDALKIVPALAGPYDFVFLDARKSDYFVCLKALDEKLAPGAVVVADNAKVFAPAMSDYLKEVRNSPRFVSKAVDFGFDAMEVSIKTCPERSRRIKHQKAKFKNQER